MSTCVFLVIFHLYLRCPPTSRMEHLFPPPSYILIPPRVLSIFKFSHHTTHHSHPLKTLYAINNFLHQDLENGSLRIQANNTTHIID